MTLPKSVFGPTGGYGYQTAFGAVEVEAVGGHLLIPGGDFVIRAAYERLGPNLLLSDDDRSVMVRDYFTHKELPNLYTSDASAVIEGRLASHLAGPYTPGQFAQAELVPMGESIGEVDKVEGRVFLTHIDGTNELANTSTKVFVGDIVETESGSNIGIVFSDETTFALGASGRMVIDDLVYDPAEETGKSTFNVVNGVFSFVSGLIAKSGDDAMSVKTPVMTIGVRGTTVAGKAAAEGSENTITLLPDADGGVGQIAVSNAAGTQLMSQPFQTTNVSSLFTSPPIPTILPASQIQNLYGNISKVLPPKPQQQKDDSGNTRSEDEALEEGEAAPEGEAPLEEETSAEDEVLTDGEEPPEGEELAEDEEPPEGEELAEGEKLPEGEALAEGEGRPIGEAPPEGEVTPEARDQSQVAEAGPIDGENNESAEDKLRGAQNQGSDDPDQEEIEVHRMYSAKEAFEQAREAGLSDSEAFTQAAESIGTTEDESRLAKEIYENALREGVSEQEALYIAESELWVAEEAESFKEGVEEAEGAIKQLVTEGLSPEDAIKKTVESAFSGGDDGRDYAETMTAVWNYVDNLQHQAATQEHEDLNNSANELILEGRDYDDVNEATYNDLNKVDTGVEVYDYEKHYQQQIVKQAEFQNIISGEFIKNVAREGTISNFDETIELTTGDDNRTGNDINTSFVAVQGSTLGGTDVIDGAGGTDQIAFKNLSDLLAIFEFPAASTDPTVVNYSTRDGGITGKLTMSNVEQLFVTDGNEANQRISIQPDSDDEVGVGIVVVGTAAGETLNLASDGTTTADITRGSLSFNLDDDEFFGSIIFGGAGNDTITTSRGDDLVFGGDGDDIINSALGADILQGGSGDDTFVISIPADIKEGEDFELIDGGPNGSVGDTLQVGDANTSVGETFLFQRDDLGGVEAANIENLKFFKNNIVFQANPEFFVNLDSIDGFSGVSGITLKSRDSSLDLTTTTTSAAISTLTGTTSFASGIQITDADDSIGRTLQGTADDDFLSGVGGDDIFIIGGGRDNVEGGAGDDTIQIFTSADVSGGLELKGGSGTDKITLEDDSITAVVFKNGTQQRIFDTETLDITGGASAGVTVSMNGGDLGQFTTIIGDGTTDILINTEGNFDARGITLTDIEQVKFTEANVAQTFFVGSNTKGDTTLNGLTTITGTVNSSNIRDDSINLNDDRGFSGITFTNMDQIIMPVDSARQTVSASTTTSFGLTSIKNFSVGSASNADIFDFTSNLTSGNNTSVSASGLVVSNVVSNTKAAEVLSENANGVLDFESSRLEIDFLASTSSEITDAVETLLESTSFLTGDSVQVAAGAINTDSLLIFYENAEEGSTSDAVIIRYQEGAASEPDFNGELSIVALFENITNTATFDNANII
jgi:hypothetical protein